MRRRLRCSFMLQQTMQACVLECRWHASGIAARRQKRRFGAATRVENRSSASDGAAGETHRLSYEHHRLMSIARMTHRYGVREAISTSASTFFENDATEGQLRYLSSSSSAPHSSSHVKASRNQHIAAAIHLVDSVAASNRGRARRHYSFIR